MHLSARFLYKIFPLTSLFLSVTVGSLYMDEEMIDFELDDFNNEAAERRGNPRAPGRRQRSPNGRRGGFAEAEAEGDPTPPGAATNAALPAALLHIITR